MTNFRFRAIRDFKPASFGQRARAHRRVARLAMAAFAASMATACASPEERAEDYYESGVALLEKGDLARANIQFRNVLRLDENHVPTLEAMAEIAEQRQDFKTMFALVQRIVRLDPDNVDAHLQLGRFYLISSDETAALERADKVEELDPGNLDALSLRAGVQLRLGNAPGAVELADKVIAAEPANAEAAAVLATERAMEGDFEGAVKELDRALNADSGAAILQVLRIRLLEQLGRDEDVIEAFKKLTSEFPDVSAYRRIYAAELVEREALAEALEQVEEAIKLEPSVVELKYDAIRLVKAQNGADAALAKFREFINAEPDKVDLRFALADFHVEEKSWDAAMDVLARLAQSDDNSTVGRAKNKIASVWLARGERDRAVALINEILANDKSNTDALIRRAQFQLEDKEYDRAIADLRAALNNDPNAYPAMVLMASVFNAQGDVAVAQAEFAKAFEASGKDPRVANAFARFLVRHENPVRAEDVLEQSLAQFPADRQNLRFLASLRLNQQDWSGANEIADILESLDVNDDDGVAMNIRAVAMSGLEEYDALVNLLAGRHERAPLASRPLARLIGAYMKTDRRDEAEQLLEGIIDSDPTNYEARILIAGVFSDSGDMAAAEATLQDAINVDPSRSEAFEALYRYYVRANNIGKATSLIDDGLTTAPDNMALRYFQADLSLVQGAREEALKLYEALAEERPDDKIVVNNYVSLICELRDDEASIARALEAARVLAEEDHPYFKDTVGWAHYRAGDFDRAVAYLTQAAAGAENNGEILYHLGAAQIAAGERRAGEETLDRALEAGGENFRYEPAIRELLHQG